MKKIKQFVMNAVNKTLLVLLMLFCYTTAQAQQITYYDNWANEGFNLEKENAQEVNITFSIHELNFSDIIINGENMKQIQLPGNFLPNDEGAPDLPGNGRYIAVPQGASVSFKIAEFRSETFSDINIAPAFRIPKETDKGPLVYKKNENIYSRNAFYPAEPVQLSSPTQIRGVDVVILGTTPFQYNPVTKELIVYRDIKIEITFDGGNGHFGEDRLRSRWWDPILHDLFLNQSSLPIVEYPKHSLDSRDGYEYLIIVPDDPSFIAWADSLKKFRNMQGISTGVVTTTDVGGNTTTAIENYINNAYNTWDVPPAAVLLLADFGYSGNTIIAPIWDYYCASDHIYADVNGNGMADIILARMTAQNETHLETMVGKVLSHERTPPTNPGFYDHPITALGWQTERWFQICAESVGGFFKNVHGKNPVRINEIYDGNPEVDPWSTASNTNIVVFVFGPDGLGYIPASPAELGGWSGGNATMINDAINDGAFLLQHRDHGGVSGWGEPPYHNGDIDDLVNTDLCYVFSINCLTGKYNSSIECFAEKFHRHQYGALGIIAASEVSYSFVNDVYVWGIYDHLWPDFLPNFNTTPDARGLLPAFGNAAGKYFLKSSGWPGNSGTKEVTYNLFHHHGGAFSVLYSEVPQYLTVINNNELLAGLDFFTVQADTGSLIALSVNGEIIGVASATGFPMDISIEPQLTGTVVDIVVTKQNYYRYESAINVISADIPYVVYESNIVNDNAGNGNGLVDYAESVFLSITMQNLGNIDAENVTVELNTSDEYITITDPSEYYGTILANQSVTVTDGFAFDVAGNIPDGHIILFELSSTDGNSTWISNFIITAHAPLLKLSEFTVSDPGGNNNGRIDPGETADLILSVNNSGSCDAVNVWGELFCDETYISIEDNFLSFGDIEIGETTEQTFIVTADENTPTGYSAEFVLDLIDDFGATGTDSFNIVIGQYPALIVDLDPYHYSGPAIQSTFENMEMNTQYFTSFPDDLGLYFSVFVTLGNIFTGHKLNEAEAELLIEYLNNGGNLYLEGRRTWYDNPQTSLHPMFNIDVVVDTWFEYDTVFGIDGTITHGMTFDYDGVTPFNDYYLAPVFPAFSILESPEPGYSCAVANYDGNYKTIGSSFELGALVNGSSPSTKEDLLTKIMDYFEDIYTDIDDHSERLSPVETKLYENYPNPFNDNTSINFDLFENSKVKIEINNINGKKVKTLINGEMSHGLHKIIWDGKNDKNKLLPPGIYFYTLNTGKEILSGKMIILR